MLEPAGDLDLAQKSLGPETLGQMRMQHLDRDGAVMTQVLRAVDRGHATATDFVRDLVAAAECGPQFGDYVHMATASSSSTESTSGRKTV